MVVNAKASLNTTLQGRPLAFAEATWILVAVLTLAAFVATVPDRYQQLLDADLTTKYALWDLGLSASFYAAYFVAAEVASMLVYALTATIIFWRKSDDWMAVFVALTLLTFGAAAPSPMHLLVTTQPAGGWLGLLLQAVGSASFLIFFYLFLDGRFVPDWTRGLAVLAVAWALAWLFFPSINPYAWPFPLPFLVFVVWFGTGLFAQIYRYRRISTLEQRQQTKWVVVGLTIAVLGDFVTHVPKYIFPALGQPGLPNVIYLFVHQPFFTASQMLVPVTIAISMMRYHLWNVDLILKRTMVYGALTAIVVGIYALIVGLLGALFQAQGNLLLSVVATGLSAVLFQPLRRRLHRAVNRLMYGESDDPGEVLARLDRRLGAALAPEAVLPTIVETVAQALKVPYAAMALKEGDQFRIVAASPPGSPEGGPSGPHTAVGGGGEEAGAGGGEVFPLVYQSDTIGQLIVAPRAPGETFTSADRRLLEEIAHHAGAAAQAVRLTADLQRSRERLVTAREEERRRLRRDLHDGLGPVLASQALKLDAVLDLLDSNPEAARALLKEIKAQAQATVADIRHLVYGLRPPALDELGLVSALREQAMRQVGATGGLRFRMDAPLEGLPPLSAALEVAAYWIAQEAITNVIRHARAHECLVRLSMIKNGSRDKQEATGHPLGLPRLELEIVDDGIGAPRDIRAGVGLTSMRERAEELGGACLIEARPTGGMRVLARLPLPPEVTSEKRGSSEKPGF